jgi:hypothetical protein
MANINVNLLSAFNDKGVKDAMTALRGLGAGFKNITKQLVGAYVGFQGFQKGLSFIRDSVDASRDLQRNMAGLKLVFGNATGEMMAFSKAGVDMGMSTAEAAKGSTLMGTMLKAAGFSMKDTASLTKTLVSLSADLAATFGYDVTEALTGMTAMFRGEYDPIEKFGVAIKQAQVNAEMARLGLSKLTGQEKLHAQQLIKIQLLMKATADVQGAFTKNSNTLFVSQQKLAATFTNLQASLGNSLIGPITTLTNLMASLVVVIGPALTRLFEAIGAKVGAVAGNAQVAAQQIVGLIDQFTILFNVAAPILEMLISLLSNFGSSLVLSFVAFKTIVPIIKGFGVVVEFLRTRMLALKVAELAAAGAAGILTEAEVALQTAALNADFALMATPWGAIAVAVAGLVAGLAFLIAEFLRLAPAADGAHTSMAQFNADMEAYAGSGNVSGYGVALFELSGDLKQVKTAALESAAAIAATRAETDLLVKGAKEATRKTYKSDPAKLATAEINKTLAGMTKLLGGGALGGAAGKAAKAMASPFAKMVKDIQSNLAQVHDSIMSTFDITNMGTNGGSISRNIDKFMMKLREFKDYMLKLRDMKLNGALYNQLAMAGPENGLAAAKALAGDASLVGQANAAYGELGMTASAIAGNVVQAKAAPVYNISVNAGVGDKKTIGLAVVEAIKSYERTNGKGWRK